jgi:hypothetical protein
MPSVVRTYDYRNSTHVWADVTTEPYSPVFLVPKGMIMKDRPGGGDPWENHENSHPNCGERHWYTVKDPQFGFPIGRKLTVNVKSGPIGDEWEGHIGGAIELWYGPLFGKGREEDEQHYQEQLALLKKIESSAESVK